jgi:hypothetical protein
MAPRRQGRLFESDHPDKRGGINAPFLLSAVGWRMAPRRQGRLFESDHADLRMDEAFRNTERLSYFIWFKHGLNIFVNSLLLPNGCVYETLGIAGFVPIYRHNR